MVLNQTEEMGKKLKVSTIQMRCLCCDEIMNFEKARKYIIEAAKAGSKLIILPELYNVGYDIQSLKFIVNYSNVSILQLSELSKELKVYIVAGVMEKVENKYFNSAVIFNDTGKLLHTYRKINLFPLSRESDFFTRGNDMQIFQINEFKFGILICYDIRFPKLSCKYTEDGCNVLLVLAAFPHPRLEHWDILLKARAIENQLYVIASNRVGKDGDLEFCGNSCIISPWGVVIDKMNGPQEGVITNEISIDEINSVRNKIPCVINITELQ